MSAKKLPLPVRILLTGAVLYAAVRVAAPFFFPLLEKLDRKL
jgi:hypothetical protein